MPDSNHPGDGSSRPWVRGGGKRIASHRDLGKPEEEADGRASSSKRPAGSAWSHYVQRARSAMEAGPHQEEEEETLDTIEIEIRDIEDEPPAPRRQRPRSHGTMPHPASDQWRADEGRLSGERRVNADVPPPRIEEPRRPSPSPPSGRGGGAPPRRPPEPPPTPPSRSSSDYPEWFATHGLEELLSGDINAATRYYKRCLKRAPDDAEGWYGTAAVQLLRARLPEGAATLVKAWKIDDDFPVARLVRDLCPDAPQAWYEFAGALVALRRKPAYECADLVLAAVVGSERCPLALRQRAAKVRGNISSALETRASTDRRRSSQRPKPSLRAALMQAVTIVLLIAASGAALMFLRAPRRATPAPEPPLPTVAGAAPADTSSAVPAASPSPTAQASGSPLTPEAAASSSPSTAPQVVASGAPQAVASPQSTPSGSPQADASPKVEASTSPEVAAPETPRIPVSTAPQGPQSAVQGGTAPVPAPSRAPSPSPQDSGTASADPSPSQTPSKGLWPPPSSPSPTSAEAADATLYISDDSGNGHPVKVNGEPVGKTPVTMLVHPGRVYTVMVAGAPGQPPWKARIKPPSGQTQRIEAVLSEH